MRFLILPCSVMLMLIPGVLLAVGDFGGKVFRRVQLRAEAFSGKTQPLRHAVLTLRALPPCRTSSTLGSHAHGVPVALRSPPAFRLILISTTSLSQACPIFLQVRHRTQGHARVE